MRKKVFVILILSLLLSVALIGCNTNRTKIQISAGEDASLATLMLSDIRFDGSATDQVRQNMITAMVEERKPEFIAINGNIVNCKNNGQVMQMAAEFFDSFDIPWATSIGKLDIAGNTSKSGILKILTNSKLKNSMVMRGESYDYNYVLEVVDSKNNVKNILYFIDTSERCSDQLVEWYKNTTINLSYKYLDRQGEKLNSHIFINNALPGFAENPENKDDYTVTIWENSASFQKAIIDSNSTRAVFAGYDNKARGAEFFYKNRSDLKFAYIRTMIFDSSMSGENYQNQRRYVGYSFYGFRDTKYVDIDSYERNPESYKPSVMWKYK